ncbi:MAG TPA: hypothetical protein VFU26_10625, partial [Gaiellaceae bacterium]|nr:hypothetical protein [Gaiellaceae bacterium]
HFEPKQYEDTYRAALLDVIKRKRQGEEIHVEAVGPEQEEPADLLAALRASVEEQARRSRKDGKRGTRTRTSSKSGRGRRRSTAARR